MPRTLILAALFMSTAWGQDFSGTWKLASQSTVTGTLAERPAAILEIVQSGNRIRCNSLEFTLDGSVAKSKAGENSYSIVTKWEGQALLVNSIVNGAAGSYTLMDRWRLSADGTRLTIGREIVRRTGSAEAKFVYARAGGAAVQAEAPKKEPVPPAPASVSRPGPPPAPEPAPIKAPRPYTVDAGTRIPLTLINSVSTKQSVEGDRIYLTTAFPIVVGGRVVIPPGSYVAGTLTFVKRPGRVRGRGELYLRFDSITLPGGLTRDLRSRVGSLDGDVKGQLDRKEGKVEGEGGKGTDAQTIGGAAAGGASIGAIAGAAAGRPGLGVGTGAAAGALAGVAAVLLSRGPDIVLARGTTLDLVLDRTLSFTEEELSPSWRRVP